MPKLPEPNTQRRAIYDYLAQGNRLTQKQATNLFYATRLSAVIKALENMGHVFDRRLLKVRTPWGKVLVAQYWLA